MLSTTLRPDHGESFTSLVRRTIRANNQTTQTLEDRFPHVNWRSRQNLMTARELRAACRVMGIPTEDARHTTMARYAIAFPTITEVIDGLRPVNSHARKNWFWVSTTQCCLRCLEETPTVWQLAWHLPWSIICERHETPLLATCPLCDAVLLEAHRCPRRIGGPRRPEELAPVLLNLWPRLGDERAAAGASTTASDLNRALDGCAMTTNSLGELACDDYLQAIRSIAGLEEHLHTYEPDRGTVTRRAVAAPPRETSRRTALLTTAHDLLHGPADGIVRHLRDGLDRLQLGSSTKLTWLRDHTIPLPALSPILEEASQGAASIGNRRMVQHRDGDESVRHVPQLIWPEVWEGLAPLTESGEVVGRSFASLTIAKFVLRASWQEAGASLGLPSHTAAKLARSGRQALLVPDGEYFETLHQMAMERVAGSPDYRERERGVSARLVDQTWMSATRMRLGVTSAFDAVLRHEAWHQYVHGHPSTTPLNASFDKALRSKLAVQKRRWPLPATPCLVEYLNSLDLLKPPSTDYLPSIPLAREARPQGGPRTSQPKE
jgi:hypothetical protein